MKRKKIFFLFLILFSTAFVSLMAGKEEISLKELPARYKKWLEEDVIYIITPKERELFLQLETDKARDIFVEAFWKQRDPSPGTPENEFKEEHYRRFSHANEYFGRETTRPGWQTERGRIYIILGPPLDIGRYEGEGFVFPAQIWSYQGNPEYGLPSHFHLIFYKRRGIGEYVLYSPGRDGPQSLLINYKGDPSDVYAAYLQLRKFDSRLAEASISLIPGESTSYGRPSLASDTLLSRVYSVPNKMVDWKYAEALLKFKDLVEVDYSVNYIGSDSLVSVIQDDSGLFFVHYSVEPEKLSVLSYEEKHRVNLELNGIVTDIDGKMIFQYEKTFPLNFNQEQIKDVEKTSIVIQDMIPLVAGDYRFSLLMKNTVSKEFTSFERNISIPERISSPSLSSLLLGYRLKKVPSQQNNNKPFRIGDSEIGCQARSVFHPHEDLIVFFQMYSLTEELRKKGIVKFTLYRNEEEYLARRKAIREFAHDNIFEKFPLQNFPPDYYSIKVSILDAKNREILSDQKGFEVTPLPDLPRPWIISKVMPASQSIVYSYILGKQFARKGKLEEAGRLLERAYNQNPLSLEYASSYAEVLFDREEYPKVKKILIPFLENPQKDFKFLPLLGASYQALEEYESAIASYKKYLSHYGTNLKILNSIGKCYYQLGNTKEALIAWEKSLEINPHQEELKRLVESLKGKQ
ncbi:hypothetical protein AMJ44_03030 [candidate division WOR-1 bacterium DG_54_3]|jgi:GWxTD domain-containing protein|uniref:GWxTD domain-containing protein n=1 Tax=candidate division WOR-1 bacterium DG_54_3 TaxID=1703775 RepID=A0A0S7Y5G6_UNCSA|nr:MAG: hypothetical protein AMJ44_03030 [candidate division WOR-1 bacterium DG_54_3]